jgi:hypothetical protein
MASSVGCTTVRAYRPSRAIPQSPDLSRSATTITTVDFPHQEVPSAAGWPPFLLQGWLAIAGSPAWTTKARTSSAKGTSSWLIQGSRRIAGKPGSVTNLLSSLTRFERLNGTRPISACRVQKLVMQQRGKWGVTHRAQARRRSFGMLAEGEGPCLPPWSCLAQRAVRSPTIVIGDVRRQSSTQIEGVRKNV